MSQRAELVALMIEGEIPVTTLCEQYRVAPKTAYKWLRRFEEGGLEALKDASCAPRTQPHKTSQVVENALVELREKHPYWGARKVRARLLKLQPDLVVPAASTCHDILVRHGLVTKRRKRSKAPAGATTLTEALAPNDVWTIDFKGKFRLLSRQYCHPLTLHDRYSRMLLRCDALPDTKGHRVKELLTRAFRKYGLPKIIRSDNGAPFAATHGDVRWSQLTVWWMRLEIVHELIAPGKPQQNGRHERMHRTLKMQTTKPPRNSLPAQQRSFDRFRNEYCEVRPHEALGMATPSSRYTPSTRRMPKHLPPIVYPSYFETRRVSRKGDLHWKGRRYFVSEALRDHNVGFDQFDDGLWRLTFGAHLLGVINERSVELGLIRPGCGAEKLLPMYPDEV